MKNEQAARLAAKAAHDAARVIGTDQAYDAADAAFGVWAAERNADCDIEAATAKAAFDVFISGRPAADRAALEANSLNNAFAIEVRDEYANDAERWAVALATARDYVDQGVTGY